MNYHQVIGESVIRSAWIKAHEIVAQGEYSMMD